MANKVKTYDIKVPVYTTEVFEKPNDFFGGISVKHMKTFIDTKIEEFSNAKIPLSFENRNKTKKTVISDIIVHKNSIDNNAILLQVSAYSTNLYDGYLETEEKIPFEKSHKIGSDTNFVMLYPIIKGIDSAKYTHQYLILVYEDPTKSNEEILKVIRQLLNKILYIPIANIKLPTILDELRKIKIIPELQIKYSAIHYDNNDVDIEYKEYFVSGKFLKNKFHKFKDMPIEKIEEIINEPNEDDYQKKEAKLIVGKKEYKITKEMINEANEEYKQTAEKVFNMRTTITESEMENNIHDIDFIFSKLKPILENYLSNGDN
ncbi:hypothetical protein EKM05_05975 [Flavobacterium sp. GSP27]|uniref:hypothetical protein n=1 Tax=Flavobacterium sp. GSP27 TaxID=2497489 RepID=UPI000F82124B|nr:hypothetical protein [Flavobacterium sp. GSP27]RTZ09850.1 hypothetical protein EKM05_05975 [Flavobacterium sp. GSP27]